MIDLKMKLIEMMNDWQKEIEDTTLANSYRKGVYICKQDIEALLEIINDDGSYNNKAIIEYLKHYLKFLEAKEDV